MVEEALQAVNFSAGVWGGLTSGSAGSMLMWVEVMYLFSTCFHVIISLKIVVNSVKRDLVRRVNIFLQ